MCWLSNACCSSFAGRVVVPLGEAARVDSPYRAFAMQPSNLTTIFSEGGHRLGVLVPMDLQRGAAGVIDRPTLPGELGQLPGHQLLRSTNPADWPRMSELFQVAAPENHGTAPGSAEACAPPPDKQPRSKLQKKLDALRWNCKALLDGFTSDQWLKTPESAFTKPVGAAAGLLQQARQVAQSSEDLVTATAWSDGLSAGKEFMRLYRLWEKPTIRLSAWRPCCLTCRSSSTS